MGNSLDQSPLFINFNLKNHDREQDKNKEVLIVMICRWNKQKCSISTKKKVKPVHWDYDAGKAKTGGRNRHHAENQRLNAYLAGMAKDFTEVHVKRGGDELLTKDASFYFRMKRGGHWIKPSDKERLEKEKIEDTPSFFEFVDAFIQKAQSRVDANRDTWKKYVTTRNHLMTFSAERELQLAFDSFTWEFREDFIDWLYSPPRESSINNASKIMEVVTRFLKEANKAKISRNTIYKEEGWYIPRFKNPKPTLYYEELKQLEALDLSHRQSFQIVRDFFVLSCYTSLRFQDLKRIAPERFSEVDGITILTLRPQKNQKKAEIIKAPVLEPAQRILRKYNFQSPPFLSHQKFNFYLKEICKLAGLDRPVVYTVTNGGRPQDLTFPLWQKVSAHTGRRTFATIFTQMGISQARLRQVTGHKKESTFQGYVNTDPDRNAAELGKEMGRVLG
jgi:integrase